MDSLEQAREALEPCPFCGSDNVSLSAFDAACLSCDATHPHGGGAWNRRARATPSTPVDGVGAEPRVKPLEWEQPDGPGGTSWLGHGTDMCQYYIRLDGKTWVMPGDVEEPEDYENLEAAKAAAQVDYERRILSALAAPPVADSEALRERDVLAKEYGWTKRNSEAAEARLAQAERGPAVTEGYTVRVCPVRDAICPHGTSCPYNDGYNCDMTGSRAALEAAIHPQSAAGEEGK